MSWEIRIFATNRTVNESNGIVLQSEFQQDEIFTFEILGLHPTVETSGETGETFAGTFVQFGKVYSGFNIRFFPIYFSQKFTLIDTLKTILGRKRLYMATRWQNQNEQKKYPYKIPSEDDSAVRIVVESPEFNEDSGYLFVELKGKYK